MRNPKERGWDGLEDLAIPRAMVAEWDAAHEHAKRDADEMAMACDDYKCEVSSVR